MAAMPAVASFSMAAAAATPSASFKAPCFQSRIEATKIQSSGLQFGALWRASGTGAQRCHNGSIRVSSGWLHGSLQGWRSLGSNLGCQESWNRTRARARAINAMFTGIVEEMGRVRGVSMDDDGACEMTVEASVVLEDVKLGDSIAVNGTCLTVTSYDSGVFTVGLSPETLRKTSLGEVTTGSQVNLERSLQPNSRMGGHFVQGHVDGTGIIVSTEPEGNSLWVKVKTSPEVLRYIVPKGYIAVDGTSLTVVDVLDEESSFTFMLVAYTQQKIVIPGKKVGNKVNLEVDILGKYVERMLQGYTVPAVKV